MNALAFAVLALALRQGEVGYEASDRRGWHPDGRSWGGQVPVSRIVRETGPARKDPPNEEILRARRAAERLLHHKGASADMADDLAAKAVAHAAEKWRRGEEIRDFVKFTCGVAGNLAKNARRKSARQAALDEAQGPRLSSGGATPEDVVIAAQEAPRRRPPGKRGRPPAEALRGAELARKTREACEAEFLESTGRPWTPDLEARTRTKITSDPSWNDDARACGALLKAMRAAAARVDAAGEGTPRFRAWVRSTLLPILERDGDALEFDSVVTDEVPRKDLLIFVDFENFLGIGRPATIRELALVSILCGVATLPKKGTPAKAIKEEAANIRKLREAHGLPKHREILEFVSRPTRIVAEMEALARLPMTIAEELQAAEVEKGRRGT